MYISRNKIAQIVIVVLLIITIILTLYRLYIITEEYPGETQPSLRQEITKNLTPDIKNIKTVDNLTSCGELRTLIIRDYIQLKESDNIKNYFSQAKQRTNEYSDTTGYKCHLQELDKQQKNGLNTVELRIICEYYENSTCSLQ